MKKKWTISIMLVLISILVSYLTNIWLLLLFIPIGSLILKINNGMVRKNRKTIIILFACYVVFRVIQMTLL